jgi:hypothetical protein
MGKQIWFLLIFSALTCCRTTKKIAGNQPFPFAFDTLTLLDQSRNRKIPVAIYKPKIDRPEIVIFSHGYAQNKGD